MGHMTISDYTIYQSERWSPERGARQFPDSPGRFKGLLRIFVASRVRFLAFVTYSQEGMRGIARRFVKSTS
jgi:hypothetical protein